MPASRRPELPVGLRSGRVEDIIAYWSQIRGRRRFPSPADVDPTVIAASWPNTLLLEFATMGGKPMADVLPRAIRITAPDAASDDDSAPPAPMVIDWALVLARRALLNAAMVRERSRFPDMSGGGWVEAVLLPLARNGAIPDHVLCHLRFG
jgi:hypothetical protein